MPYEKVVMRSPVSPKAAVHAGRRSLTKLTTRMTMKLSQNLRPIAPPRAPVVSVATAMFALNLTLLVMFANHSLRGVLIPESASIPKMGYIFLSLVGCNTLNTTCLNRKGLPPC